jgi:acetyl esterase/lipase
MVAGLTAAKLTPEALAVTAEGIEAFRKQKEAECAAIAKEDEYFYATKRPECSITESSFETRDGATLKMFIIKPKDHDMNFGFGIKHAAYVYAHGGGGIFGKAEESNDYLCATALNLNCVVFNIDYRLGPEVKCPKGMEDFVDGLEHIVSKADTYSIDKSKICIAGISGGGWIVAGAANMLAAADKTNLVKAMFIHTGMLSDETAKLSEDQLEKPFEYWMAPYLTSAYKLHATDFEK